MLTFERLLARPAAWWAVFLGLCALLVAPLVVADFPPILDYPNHLARLLILAQDGRDPVLARMWQPHWAIIPDLGIDLPGPPLVRLLGPFVAGKLLLALALLAPMTGAVLYSRAAFRERLYWPFSAALTAYSLVFVLGFMNYLLALGAALAAGGLWLRLAGRPLFWRGLAGAACACGLFFVHLFGVALYLLLVAAAEWRLLRARRRGAALPAALLAATAAGPLALWALSPASPHAIAYDWSLPEKLFYLAGPFLSYRALPGLLAGTAFLAAVALWISDRRSGFAPGLLPAAPILLLVYLGVPFALGGGTFVDARLPPMLALLASAGIRPSAAHGWRHRAAAAALVLGFAASWGSVMRVWGAPNAPAAELRAVIAPVPPGARVLVAMPPVNLRAPYWRTAPPAVLALGLLRIDYQLPALLAIDRRAFWPFLFSDPSQHPVRVAAPYAALAVPQGAPPDLASLVAGRSLDPRWPAPFLRHWRQDFDYLLLLDAGAVARLPAPLAAGLEPVDAGHFAALFRVRRPVNATPGEGRP